MGDYEQYKRIAKKETRLTTTMNPNYPPFTPEPIGSSGGIGGASPYQERNYSLYPWLPNPRYSPFGSDLT